MSIEVKQKSSRRGRPATGKNPILGLRMAQEQRKAIEEWAANEADRPKLSEAVRRLVELGLKRKRKRAGSDATQLSRPKL